MIISYSPGDQTPSPLFVHPASVYTCLALFCLRVLYSLLLSSSESHVHIRAHSHTHTNTHTNTRTTDYVARTLTHTHIHETMSYKPIHTLSLTNKHTHIHTHTITRCLGVCDCSLRSCVKVAHKYQKCSHPLFLLTSTLSFCTPPSCILSARPCILRTRGASSKATRLFLTK